MIHARLFSPRTIAGNMLLFELHTVAHPKVRSLEESCACGDASKGVLKHQLSLWTNVLTAVCASPAQIHRLEEVAPSRGETGGVSAARLWGGSGYRVMTRHQIGWAGA